MNTQFDICIIGGGPVGLAVAAGLPQSLRVALIEPNAAALQKTLKFDGRTIALAHQGVTLFEKIGIWKKLKADAAPIKTIRVADQHSRHNLTFDSTELPYGPFGHMVENRHLRAALWDTVKARKNVTVFCPNAVKSFNLDGSMATVLLDNGSALTAKLVIAADGRTSPSRTQLGTKSFAFNYAQQAIICTVEHTEPHHELALEHFLPEGPFAALPLKGRRSGIVWTIKPETAKALMSIPDADFIQLMKNAGADYLGEMKMLTPRATYPLALSHGHAYTAPHFALIGDAAHAMHPIAGQGFNMGLRDVACLLKLIEEAAARGLRPDDASVLQQYETQRRGDNQAMLAATDVIDRMFSNTLPLLTPARQWGLTLVDKIGPLRRWFMQQAMGLKSAA